ncbi:AMP-binding protein, partial [Nocardia sp.]|uniref:AMP-binding protein n=1 Tax=Nocardia sp. TaxID=1821 RepID=UPI002590A1F7
YFGALKAGAVVVPLNVLLKPREIAYHLTDSDAKALFCFEGTPELPLGESGYAGFQQAEGCEHFFLLPANPSAAESPIEGAELFWAALGDQPNTFDPVSTGPDDTAVIIYTSGTTGQPKGAELSHSNLLTNAMVSDTLFERTLHDTSLDWLAREVAAGKVIAAGHGERGNDLAIDDSTTGAVPVEGGYLVNGHKIFTSLSPAWDWLGIHARDDSDPERPRIIHAFVPRHSEGVRTVETWDTLGVRATASHDTVLTDVFVAQEYVIDSYERGANPGPFISSILPWAIPALVNVYLGIGRRAVDVALESARTRNVLSLGGRPVAGKPFVQYHAAEAELALEAATAHLDHITEVLARGDDLGDRLLLALFAVKENGTRTARTVVDIALEIGGGGSIHRRNELERLYRDVRAGSFHPPSSDSVREYIGNFLLGE